MMGIDDTEITLACAEDDYGDHRLTFAEAGEIIGANARSVRLAVREGLLAAVPGENGELRVTRAALDEFVPPRMQAFQREWKQLLRGANAVFYARVGHERTARQIGAECSRGTE